MTQGYSDKITLTNKFLDPENMRVDTKIYLLHDSGDEIGTMQQWNGGHFEIMLIGTDAMIW